MQSLVPPVSRFVRVNRNHAAHRGVHAPPRPHHARQVGARSVIGADAASTGIPVLPAFLDAYARLVCNPEHLPSCLDLMVVPPVEDQARVMRALADAADVISGGSGELPVSVAGALLRLFLAGGAEIETAHQLVEALLRYDQAADMVRAIIRHALELPLGDAGAEYL